MDAACGGIATGKVTRWAGPRVCSTISALCRVWFHARTSDDTFQFRSEPGERASTNLTQQDRLTNTTQANQQRRALRATALMKWVAPSPSLRQWFAKVNHAVVLLRELDPAVSRHNFV